MYLLDTDALSELVKKRPSSLLLHKIEMVPQEALFTSSVSVMELRLGAMRRAPDGQLWEQIQEKRLSRVKPLSFS